MEIKDKINTMIIILEGSDKTGKTTLAKKIEAEYGFNYIKCSQPKGDPYVEYMDILKNIRGNTVIDRFNVGELVYGPIYRGKSQISPEQFRNIELKAMTMDAIIIYCSDDIESIKKRFKDDSEDFTKESDIKKILNLYLKVLDKSILPVKFHQIKKNEIKLGKVIKQLDEIKWKTVVGNVRNPKLILIGDKRNEEIMKKYSPVSQPFDFGKSSKFLFDSLAKASINLADVAILNSDSKEFKKFIFSNTGKIVALGKNASAKLKKLKIRFYELNHPSYEARFNVKNSKFWKQLNEIMYE